ncbi:MAG: Pectinesterase A [Candidatus Celerinatantimonas neptuna]|nr:MAG: Pectinesterase A [Candidatus Celerinatantimonas neptuna]
MSTSSSVIEPPVFDSCDIVSKPRGKETSPLGYVTAPSTDIDTTHGLVFYYSYLTKESSVDAKTYGLGRPWHPTRTFSDGRYADPDAKGYTLYFHCYMDNHVYFWGKMSGKDKNGNKIWFYPFKNARFAEYKSTGPGAKVTSSYKRPQLSNSEAGKITLKNILGGNWYKE